MIATIQRRAQLIATAAVAACTAALLAGASPPASAATHEGPQPWLVSSSPVSVGGHYNSRISVNPATYPYRTARISPPVRDPWGETERQCVSYAAWWLNRHGVHLTVRTLGPSGIGDFLNADVWPAASRYAGWAISGVARPGAIAEWNANESSRWVNGSYTYVMTAGPTGHVAVVLQVLRDGLVRMAQYNGNIAYGYNTFVGRAPRYLLIGNPPR